MLMGMQSFFRCGLWYRNNKQRNSFVVSIYLICKLSYNTVIKIWPVRKSVVQGFLYSCVKSLNFNLGSCRPTIHNYS